jgi:opacity protein-like surface antigen
MKKLLLVAAATAALSTSAMADSENMFYLRGDLGAGMFQKAKDKSTGLKMKSKTSMSLDLGVGYYVMDNMRGDLVFVHHFNPEMKKGGNATTVSAKHKANIETLMLKGYVDVAEVSVAKIFVGAGVGFAQISEKITWGDNTSLKAKKKNNMAYSLALGSGFDLADGVKGDVAYNFSDFGKTKSAKEVGDDTECAKTSYRSHSVKFGVRFDI